MSVKYVDSDSDQFRARMRVHALDAALRYCKYAWNQQPEDLTDEDVVDHANTFESYLMGEFDPGSRSPLNLDTESVFAEAGGQRTDRPAPPSPPPPTDTP